MGMAFSFSRQRPVPADRCERCGAMVRRVWLVPGDVLNSCAGCFERATGRQPVHGQGHSTREQGRSVPTPAASFYLRADGRRPA